MRSKATNLALRAVLAAHWVWPPRLAAYHVLDAPINTVSNSVCVNWPLVAVMYSMHITDTWMLSANLPAYLPRGYAVYAVYE